MGDSKKKKTYSKQFKLDAIRMYLSGQHGGYTPVADMLGICRTNLINWVAIYAKEGEVGLEDGRGKEETKQFVLPPPIEGLPLKDENLRLRAENAYLRSLLELNIDTIKKTYYEVIDMLRAEYPLKLLLEVSGIKRSSYYKWRKSKDLITNKKAQDLLILEGIKELYHKHKGRYGVQRMTHALVRELDIKANHKRVHRIMRENGYLAVIKAKNKQRYKKTEYNGKNVLNRNFKGSCPYDKLATDITEIKKNRKTIYVSPIKDLYTNMIESWEASGTLI